MKKIETITEKNKEAFPKYVSKWTEIGLSTERFSLDEAIDIVHPIQRVLLGKEATPVLLFDNPMLCWIACHLANKNVPINDIPAKVQDFVDGKERFKLESFCSPFLSGSFSVPNFSFYDCMFNEIGVEIDEELKSRYNIWEASSKLGMIFPLDNVCIVSQKPIKIVKNEQGQIHCDCGGPAIEYAGQMGEKIFALNGVVVPEWLANTQSSKLNLDQYNTIFNADVKMEFVRKFGVERMLSFGKKIDSYENYDNEFWTKSEYEIWDMKALFETIDYAPHLKMLNQTTKVWHVEALPPDVRDLEQAMFRRMNNRKIEIKAIA